MTELKGTYALITGASSGIGKAIAHSLAGEGVHLIITGRNTKKLESVKKLLENYKIHIELVTSDITLKEDRRKLTQLISTSFNKLDILIHSAGSIIQTPVAETSDEILEQIFSVNFFAPFQLTRDLMPLLKKSNGQIIFINSSAIQRPMASLSHYSASKHAMKGFADALREEVNQDGIRVMSIYPGKTATEMQKKLYQENKKEYLPEKMIQPEDIAIAVINAMNMPRTVELTDIYLRPMQKS